MHDKKYQKNIRGIIMWIDNLKELKKKSGKTSAQIAEETKIPESTIKRIFGGGTDDPRISTIRQIVICLGGSLDQVLADTNAVLATESLAEVKETARAVEAESDLIAAENKVLRDKVAALSAEVELLNQKLSHKEELIAVHNYYMGILKRGE
jgi:predicted transcriptional regulator